MSAVGISSVASAALVPILTSFGQIGYRPRCRCTISRKQPAPVHDRKNFTTGETKLIARNFVEDHRQMPVVIHIVRAALIAFLAGVTGTAAQTSVNGPVTVFDFTFPEEIAGAQRFNIGDHESSQPGMGYSAAYRQGSLTGTVYIYDDGEQSIPDDPQSPLVKAQLEKSRTDVVGLWHGVGVTVGVKEDFTIEDAQGRTRLICAAFAIIGDDGRPRDTFACLGVAKSKFLKFRISGASQAEAKRFVNAWINLLWPPS